MDAAVAGTWAADLYGIHSDHFFTVGIGMVGVSIAALLARAFSSDNRDRRQVEGH